MSWWWEQISGSLWCGGLASFTWVTLVWMSATLPVKGWGWLKGIGILLLSNGMAWLALSLINLPWLGLWATIFVVVNGGMGYWMRSFPDIEIPFLWSVAWHPIGITTMVILLAGVMDRFTA